MNVTTALSRRDDPARDADVFDVFARTAMTETERWTFCTTPRCSCVRRHWGEQLYGVGRERTAVNAGARTRGGAHGEYDSDGAQAQYLLFEYVRRFCRQSLGELGCSRESDDGRKKGGDDRGLVHGTASTSYLSQREPGLCDTDRTDALLACLVVDMVFVAHDCGPSAVVHR